MAGPLAGIVVVDFSQLAQGPFATQILGDLGAEIIKVEAPSGDWMRGYSLQNAYAGGMSVSFITYNRNKRSIVLDLKSPDGVDIARRLIDRADVVVENFRPGVMERLGLGYETLVARNPRIVYCASVGYGQDGPYVGRPGQDLLVQSLAGLASLGGRDQDPPAPAGRRGRRPGRRAAHRLRRPRRPHRPRAHGRGPAGRRQHAQLAAGARAPGDRLVPLHRPAVAEGDERPRRAPTRARRSASTRRPMAGSRCRCSRWAGSPSCSASRTSPASTRRTSSTTATR